MDIYPTSTKIELVAVDKVFVPRRTYYPLKPCGSSVSVNKKINIVRHDELLDSTRINIIFRTGSRFLASGFLGSLANSGD